MSKLKMHRVKGTESDVGFVNYDPADWRDREDPEADGQFEDDQDRPTPRGVKVALGFDPDDEGWDDEDTPADRLQKAADVDWDEMYP